MPHTNRKKKLSSESKPKFIQSKRQLLEDDKGWTHVVDVKKTSHVAKVNGDSKEDNPKLSKSLEGDFISGNVAIVTMDLKEVEAEYARFTQQWESSEACTQLKTIVTDRLKDQRITKIVCLGLGSLQNCFFHARRTSHTQLAALRTIIKTLGLPNLKQVAQEPCATALDKEFLKGKGIESLDDPQGIDHIDEETLVFAVHCYADLYQQIGKASLPVVLIASDIERHIENMRVLESRSEDEEKKLKELSILSTGVEVVPFPQIRYDFSDTSIYLKTTGVSVEKTHNEPTS